MVLGAITDEQQEECRAEAFAHFVARLLDDKVGEGLHLVIISVRRADVQSLLFVQVTQPREVSEWASGLRYRA